MSQLFEGVVFLLAGVLLALSVPSWVKSMDRRS